MVASREKWGAVVRRSRDVYTAVWLGRPEGRWGGSKGRLRRRIKPARSAGVRAMLVIGLLLLLPEESAAAIVPETPCQLSGGNFTVFDDDAYCDGFQDGNHLGNPPTPEGLCDPSTVDYPCCIFNNYIFYHKCDPSPCSSLFGPTMTMTIDAFGYMAHTLNCALYEPPAGNTSTTTATAVSPASEGLSSGAVVGIVVGGILGPFFLGGIYAYFSPVG